MPSSPLTPGTPPEQPPGGEPGKVAEVHQLFPPAEPLSKSFHMVNRLLPEAQEVVSVPPGMRARDALAIMKEHGYSQLPVVQGSTVLGLFTYRDFALGVTKLDPKKVDPSELPVEEFVNRRQTSYAGLTEDVSDLLDGLDEHDAVVVSGEHQLIAILTPMDVLRYLHAASSAFVLIEEIELALRRLIQAAVHDPTVLAECITNALSSKYTDEKRRPARLEDMSFDDFVSLLRDGRNWPRFAPFFGGMRELTEGKLAAARELRNTVFHFRREITADEREALIVCRDWLLMRIRNEEAKRQAGAR